MFVRRNRILPTEISVLLVTDAEKVFIFGEKSYDGNRTCSDDRTLHFSRNLKGC